jgi:cytochrome d ubiquinol oxidase subunit II
MIGQRAGLLLLLLTVVSLPATISARADTLANYRSYPVTFVIPLAILLSLLGMIRFSRKGADRNAFLCSCIYLAMMMVGAAVALYPRLLPSSADPSRDITIAKAVSSPYTLQVGLAWWSLGMVLALTYFVIVYHMFRGKVSLEGGGYH